MKGKKVEERWLVMYLPEPLAQFNLIDQTITPLSAPGPAPLLVFDVDAEAKQAEKTYLEGALYKAKLRALARTAGRENSQLIPGIDPKVYDGTGYSGEPFSFKEAMTIAVYEDNAVGVMLGTYPFTILDRARCEHELGIGAPGPGLDQRRSAAIFKRCLERGEIPGILQHGGWVYTTPRGLVAWAVTQRDRDWQDIKTNEVGLLLGKGRHQKYFVKQGENYNISSARSGRASLHFTSKVIHFQGKIARCWLIPPLDLARQAWNERMHDGFAWLGGESGWATLPDSGWEDKIDPDREL